MDLQSKIKTSVPYTIPELYTSIAELVTQKIKESEERMMSWISEEIGKIAPEKREKDLDERRASSHKAVPMIRTIQGLLLVRRVGWIMLLVSHMG